MNNFNELRAEILRATEALFNVVSSAAQSGSSPMKRRMATQRLIDLNADILRQAFAVAETTSTTNALLRELGETLKPSVPGARITGRIDGTPIPAISPMREKIISDALRWDEIKRAKVVPNDGAIDIDLSNFVIASGDALSTTKLEAATIGADDISRAVERPLKDAMDIRPLTDLEIAELKVELIETALREIEATDTHRDHVRTLGSFNWDARIAAHNSPIIQTSAKVRDMLDLARADLRRLEEQEFGALTVDEVKAKIDALRKGA